MKPPSNFAAECTKFVYYVDNVNVMSDDKDNVILLPIDHVL